MINPNKNYKAKVTATIVKIDPLDAYIPYITIKTTTGEVFEGDLMRAYSKPHLLKVGDEVRFTGQFSMVADKFLVSSIVRVRKSKSRAISQKKSSLDECDHNECDHVCTLK